ncbi:HAMP domain-containing sensor histidine kinase [Glycomyces terrestris]|uniref:histidine kinase n=1 Tax=Glycomyces terrestris TaxID=2493553 RepID=A0A426V4F6_9ACTN|nr:HAMP domain-containing sensor histidine kinase [Glycomyces terrestris]RRS01773.1 sensor histidine kinase [Glycomyces terrestris]
MTVFKSLRVRLALTGFLASYLPVVLVFAVTAINQESYGEVGADGVERTVSRTGIVPSGWAVLTVVLLLPATAALAWWWAGRAVRPFARVRAAAERIEGTDLGLRVGSAQGTTEAVALAAAFDSMLDRLERSAAVQRQLIEEASHELRTPLAVLITGADVVLAHPEPDLELYREGLERSRGAAHRLRDVVDELLVDARGRARVIDRRPVDLAALAREVAAEFAPAPVVVTGDAAADAAVDGPSVRRAVANLVGNAVKHAPEGTDVVVEVAAGPDAVSLTVSDEGPGIPEADRERVFERFWRGESAPGTGLGLPIARQIAQAHGGDVALLDGGEGCRFRLTLPKGR